jgi:hypothetical protein
MVLLRNVPATLGIASAVVALGVTRSDAHADNSIAYLSCDEIGCYRSAPDGKGCGKHASEHADLAVDVAGARVNNLPAIVSETSIKWAVDQRDKYLNYSYNLNRISLRLTQTTRTDDVLVQFEFQCRRQDRQL